MFPSRVQRIASRVLRNIHSLRNVECSVRLYDPKEQSEESFCKQLDEEIDTKYAEFDGARRHEYYMALTDDQEDTIDSCCKTCMEREERNRKLRKVSKTAAELAAAGRDTTSDVFMIVIVPGKPIMNHTSRGSTSFEKHAFTVFLPRKTRVWPSYNDTGESLRLMIIKDYLRHDPEDKQCCRCSASIDSISHARCDKCMSWMCATCIAEIPLMEESWRVQCANCDKKKDILDAMNELAWHEKNRWPNIWRALDQVMQRKKVDRIPVTIMDEDGACFHTTASTTAASRMAGKKKRRDIVFIGKNVPTEEQLMSRESVFVVGDMPVSLEGTETMRKSMRLGVVLSNTESGDVIEVKDLFAPYSVLVSRDKGIAVTRDDQECDDSSSDCDSDYEPIPSRTISVASFSGYSHTKATEVGSIE